MLSILIWYPNILIIFSPVCFFLTFYSNEFLFSVDNIIFWKRLKYGPFLQRQILEQDWRKELKNWPRNPQDRAQIETKEFERGVFRWSYQAMGWSWLWIQTTGTGRPRLTKRSDAKESFTKVIIPSVNFECWGRGAKQPRI